MRPFPYQKWFVSLLICAFVVAVAFRYVDVLIARRVYAILSSADTLATGFGSAVLLGIEAVITLALVMIRIVRGQWWRRRAGRRMRSTSGRARSRRSSG